ncbi:MAG: GspH/FimT family pseudopilin [Herbaspirillum sp.]
MYAEKSLVFGHPRCRQGFTLIELMITITIAGILMAIAIPSMRDMVHQNRLAGHVNEFVAANMLARSEAIKRGSSVTLCPSASAESATACTAAGDWSTGWLVVVVDKNEILTRQGALPAGTTITSALSSIVYNGMGQPVLAAASASTRFTFDNDCRLSRRQVDIGRTGRTDVTTVAAVGC